MKPGDIVTADSGRRYVIGDLLAVQGQDGCTDPRCTRNNGRCVGYHCPTCGVPTSSQGHNCPEREAAA